MKWVPLLILAEFPTPAELLEHLRIDPAQRGQLLGELTEAGACQLRWRGLPLVLALTTGRAVSCAPCYAYARDTIDEAWTNDPQTLAVQFDDDEIAAACASASARTASSRHCVK